MKLILNFLDYYVLFDFPGQVELYTHYDTVKNIMEKLEKWNYRVKLFSIFLNKENTNILINNKIAYSSSFSRCSLLF